MQISIESLTSFLKLPALSSAAFYSQSASFWIHKMHVTKLQKRDYTCKRGNDLVNYSYWSKLDAKIFILKLENYKLYTKFIKALGLNNFKMYYPVCY